MLVLNTHSRRGVVAVAMVAALVVVSLVILGAVVLGAGDSDMAGKQASAMRAFYAADSGMNMATRELELNVDFDGDGGIGTISNDANSANDPTIGTARTNVSLGLSGLSYTLSSNGSCDSSRRAITSNASRLLGGARWMLYCNWPNATPSVAQWNGRAWTAPTGTLDNGSQIKWALLKRCTPRMELLAATTNNGNDCRAMIFNGTAWGNALVLTTDVGTTAYRPFYIAYERSSGNGLIVFRKSSNTNIYYRTWNGSAWSGELSFAPGLASAPRYMKLFPKPSANEIMLMALDGNNNLFASVWNGSAWTNTVTLDTATSSITQECFDLSYEATTGRCMVAWGRAGSAQPQYRTWDGVAWSATSAAPAFGSAPVWVRLASNPTSAGLALGAVDAAGTMYTNIWSGSSWGAAATLAAGASSVAYRPLDIAWEPDGTRALCVMARSSTRTPYYSIWNGSAWGALQTAMDLGYVPMLMQLDASQSGKEILFSCTVSTGQNGLVFMKWNGTSFANYALLEGNVSGPTPQEVFMLSDTPPGSVGNSARILGWDETAP